MPELPEVETLKRCIETMIVGRRIDDVAVHETRLRYPLDTKLLRRSCRGKQVVRVWRRSKYLVIELDKAQSILVHLGMSGRLLMEAAESERALHTHVCFRMGDEELRFCDPRRFGFVEAIRTDELESDPRMQRLGPEPLDDSCDGRLLFDRSRSSRQAIKNFLMNAGHVVGVGNIYANEALFLAGIHPKRQAGRVGLARWESLMTEVKRVLREAIDQGGTTLNDWQNPEGESGYFQVHLRVYGREEEPCVACDDPIRRVVIGGRSTFFCPSCQR